MRNVVMLLAVLAALVPGRIMAEETPSEFLSALLKEDFVSEGTSRYNKDYYTDGKGDIVGDCDCSEPRGLFVPWQDPVVFVAAEWKLNGLRMETPSKAIITVYFSVLARTEGRRGYIVRNGVPIQIYRKIIPLPSPEEETVVYRVWKIKGHWKLVDPPLPRISISSPIKEILYNINKDKEILAESPDRDDLRNELQSYQEQLRVLKALTTPRNDTSTN